MNSRRRFLPAMVVAAALLLSSLACVSSNLCPTYATSRLTGFKM